MINAAVLRSKCQIISRFLIIYLEQTLKFGRKGEEKKRLILQWYVWFADNGTFVYQL